MLALVSSLLVSAASSTCLTPKLRDCIGLATGVWACDDFISAAEAGVLLSRLPHKTSDAWYPCPRQETSWPSKRCAKLELASIPLLETLRSRLEAAWANLTFDSLSHIAVAVDMPTNATAMRHDYHRDVFPERGVHATGPSTTMSLYLTAPHRSHPLERSGATIFPDAGLQLRPRVGRLLAWANVCADGSPAPNSRHGVGAYSGDDQPERVALHIPVEGTAGRSEHVGCSGPPRGMSAKDFLGDEYEPSDDENEQALGPAEEEAFLKEEEAILAAEGAEQEAVEEKQADRSSGKRMATSHGGSTAGKKAKTREGASSASNEASLSSVVEEEARLPAHARPGEDTTTTAATTATTVAAADASEATEKQGDEDTDSCKQGASLGGKM
jgi:hypothetical protein